MCCRRLAAYGARRVSAAASRRIAIRRWPGSGWCRTLAWQISRRAEGDRDTPSAQPMFRSPVNRGMQCPVGDPPWPAGHCFAVRLARKRPQISASERTLRQDEEREADPAPTRRGARHGPDREADVTVLVPLDDESLLSGNGVAEPRAVSETAPRALIDDTDHAHRLAHRQPGAPEKQVVVGAQCRQRLPHDPEAAAGLDRPAHHGICTRRPALVTASEVNPALKPPRPRCPYLLIQTRDANLRVRQVGGRHGPIVLARQGRGSTRSPTQVPP